MPSQTVTAARPRGGHTAESSRHKVCRSRAPLRLGFAGGGTDVSPYCDQWGGLVLNATIDRFCYASVEDGRGGPTQFNAADTGLRSVWGDEVSALPLHAAVYQRLSRVFDLGQPSLVVTTVAEAPPGSGLGSSSTMVVAMIDAYREFFGLPLSDYEIARVAFQIEREDCGLAGGRQDQYAATFGGFNFIEFGANDRVIVNPLRVKAATRMELEASLLLYFTGVSRESARIIDNQSAAVGQGGSSLDAMHQLKADAIDMKEALLLGRLTEMGDILNRTWLAKKATSAGVSNEVIEAVLETARANGARSAKVSGAGGGGFIMLLCDPTRRTELSRALCQLGRGQPMICQLTNEGSVSWRVR